MSLSPGEKLIITMLCEISKSNSIKMELDPDFILEAIYNKHEWGLQWEYDGLFDNNDFERPAELSEVIDILNMWEVIENYYKKSSSADKKTIINIADIFGDNPTFKGFDGNNETTHYSIAFFLVNQLNRFSRFEGRSMNSHMPSLETHRRMLRVFEMVKMKHDLNSNFTAEEIGEILKAKNHDYQFDN